MRIGMGLLALALVGAGLAFAEDEVEKIDVGAKAPPFRLNDQHGKAVRLSDPGNGGWTIVAFYPKSDTPG